MSKFVYFIGNDNGNSEHEIIINGVLINQPNVNCVVDSIPWSEEQAPQSFIKNLQDQLIVTVDSPSAKKAMYYVGKFALESGEVVNNMQVGVDDKASSELPIINTLAQVAAMAVQDGFKKLGRVPDELEVVADMTTCLPVIQYTKESASLFESRFTSGIHTVFVHLGHKQVKVTIVFEFVKAIPEATPVTFSLQRNTNGDWRTGPIFAEFVSMYHKELPTPLDGSYFKDKRILHTDIGDGTTEYPVTEGNVFLRHLVSGSNHGVGHAIEEALEQFNRLIFLPDSPRQFLSDVIKNSNHRYYQHAVNTLRRPLEAQAQQIIKNIKKQLTKARNEIDIICVYGGGSIIMKEALYSSLLELCNERQIKLLYIPADSAVNLNVEGLDIFCRGKIFQTLKTGL